MSSYRKMVSTKGFTKVDVAESDIEARIDQLLKQLQQVNSHMQTWVSSGGSEMVSHTLTRHQEILQDLTQMDNVISQAQATLGSLVFQRSTFGGINLKLRDVSSRLPMVNSILTSIKRKKSTDTIILSLVAFVCTFLMLIYWLSK